MESNIVATGKTAVKPTARGQRVWIEGGKLAKAGFQRGMKYKRVMGTGSMLLVLDESGEYEVAGRDRNGKALPIDAVVNDLIDGDLELTSNQKNELLQLARDLIAELEGFDDE